MADSEKIDIVKAVTSPFTGLFWVKTIMYCLGASALFFIGYGVYKAYFKKPLPSTTQNAEQICNYNYTPKMIGFGCIRMK